MELLPKPKATDRQQLPLPISCNQADLRVPAYFLEHDLANATLHLVPVVSMAVPVQVTSLYTPTMTPQQTDQVPLVGLAVPTHALSKEIELPVRAVLA